MNDYSRALRAALQEISEGYCTCAPGTGEASITCPACSPGLVASEALREAKRVRGPFLIFGADVPWIHDWFRMRALAAAMRGPWRMNLMQLVAMWNPPQLMKVSIAHSSPQQLN